MKKSRAALQIALIVLLFVSMLFGYQQYLFRQNKSSIEALIRNDQRFHDIQMATKGAEIFLRGQVKSKADLQALYSEINRIKRIQVGSSVRVAE